MCCCWNSDTTASGPFSSDEQVVCCLVCYKDCYKSYGSGVDAINSSAKAAMAMGNNHMVACVTAADLQAADLPGTPYLRYAASELLDAFRWLKRYADDITVGPNRFVEQLLYTNQWVFGRQDSWAVSYYPNT
jgi:hypothetical protein